MEPCDGCSELTKGYAVPPDSRIVFCPACLTPADDGELIPEVQMRMGMDTAVRLCVAGLAEVIEVVPRRPHDAPIRYAPLPQEVEACVRRLSREVLFSVLGDSLIRLGSSDEGVGYVMRFFNNEPFEWVYSPEPVASFIERAERAELLSACFECVGQLLGGSGWKWLQRSRDAAFGEGDKQRVEGRS